MGLSRARDVLVWLARKDSNLQSPDPESGALPLGHSPVEPVVGDAEATPSRPAAAAARYESPPTPGTPEDVAPGVTRSKSKPAPAAIDNSRSGDQPSHVPSRSVVSSFGDSPQSAAGGSRRIRRCDDST